MAAPRIFPALLVLLAALIAAPSTRAAESPTPQGSARLIVHLLEYLGSDYAGAVSEQGKVISESEFKEQREFAATAAEEGARIPALSQDPAALGKLIGLRRMIEGKAPPREVSAAAWAAKELVISRTGLAQAPERWPELAHGRQLYAQNCASCHGELGDGNGPAGAALEPHPANFKGATLAKAIFPLRAFNSIRLGVPGTAMVPWPQLSDADTWDLAFYVTSLHLEGQPTATMPPTALELVATRNDEQLRETLPGDERQKQAALVALRLHSGSSGGLGGGPGSPASSLALARQGLQEARAAYSRGENSLAREAALNAYLKGVEPVEPALRGRDPGQLVSVENAMAAVRGAIDGKLPLAELETRILAAGSELDRCARLLDERVDNPLTTFLLTVGILIREGFEAVLIILALLAVIRASGQRRAASYVHAGWISALALGWVIWLLAGELMDLSGATREKLEGYTSLIAVAVLLVVGFWLHRRTEIRRWKEFIEDQVQSLLSGSRLWGLAAISFMAVFREAFETVLFLRAIALGDGGTGARAMGIGVLCALSFTIGVAWLLLRSSAKLPIRKIFALSSGVMAVLAVILTGKGIHSLQEAGLLNYTYWSDALWIQRLRSDWLGLYPTWESFLPQALILALIVILWKWNSTPVRAATPTPASGGSQAGY